MYLLDCVAFKNYFPVMGMPVSKLCAKCIGGWIVVLYSLFDACLFRGVKYRELTQARTGINR